MRMRDRDAIARNLRRLQPGQFQGFCLSFFPLYDSTLSHLIPHGGRADDKTRAGTPDLLHTASDGKETAVQCSTDEDYWKAPADVRDYETWKPIKDVRDCRSELNSLVKVFLCSSQEIPTNQSSVKSIIIQHCSDRFQLQVEPWSNADFTTTLAQDIEKYENAIREYLRDASDEILEDKSTAIERLAVAIYKQQDVGTFDAVLAAVTNAVQRHGIITAEPDLIAEISNDLLAAKPSKFRYSFSKTQLIKRPYDWSLLGGIPCGRILSLRGDPGIGKTLLLNQLAVDYGFADSEIEHLSCTLTESAPDSEKAQFLRDSLLAITQGIVRARVIDDFLASHLSLDQLVTNANFSTIKTKLVVIDNSENLDSWTLNQLDSVVLAMKRAALLHEKGVVFASIQSMLGDLRSLDSEYLSPRWTEDEISQLLDLEGLSVSGPREAHIRLLSVASHFHPRLAIAIARQNPSFPQLLEFWGKRKQTPLYDIEFNDEVKSILYNDLVHDDDSRHVVRIASSLIFAFKVELIEELVQSLKVPLVRPVRQIVAQLERTVLEALGSDRYSVGPLYREIASADESERRRKEVLAHAGDLLFSIRDHVIDSVEACDGVFSSIVAGEFTKGFYRAGFLLLAANSSKLPKERMEYLFDRLEFLSLMNPVAEADSWITYCMMELAFMMNHFRLEDDFKKRESSRRLSAALSMVPHDARAGNELYEAFTLTASAQEIFTALSDERWDDALSVINTLSVTQHPIEVSLYQGVVDMMPHVLRRATTAAVPNLYLISYVKSVTPTESEKISSLIRCGLGIGNVARSRRWEPQSQVPQSLDESPLWKIFSNAVLAQHMAEGDKEAQALPVLYEGMAELAAWSAHPKVAGRLLRVLEADVYYRLGRRDEAKSSYELLAKEIDPTGDPFHWAWSKYRCAILEESVDKAANNFREAAPVLREHGSIQEYAIAIGEVAVIDYGIGKRAEAVRSLAQLIQGYFGDNDEEFGPAAWAAGNLMTNLSQNDPPKTEDWKDESGNTFFGLRRGVFMAIRRDARPSRRKILTYRMLSEAFRKLELFREQREALSVLLNETPEQDIEVFAQIDACYWMRDSFREKAQLQADCLLRLLKSEDSGRFISPFGRMLLATWSYYTYRRLSASDLHVWRLLGEHSRTINSLSIIPEKKYAAMILLLFETTTLRDEPVAGSLRRRLQADLEPDLLSFPEDIASLLRSG